MEGITLSSTDTVETTSTAQDAVSPEQEGHEHHQHGPVFNPDCTREIELSVPAEEVSKSFRKVVKRYQKLAQIPGFRAGKVPESLIRGRFADSIRQDVMESLLPEQFRTAIEAQGLKPVSQPQVTELTVEDGQPLHCKAAFEVLPAFSIDGYQDVKVEKPSTELTEEEFQAELERLRDSRGTIEPVDEDRALVDGDWAQISFRGEFKGETEEPTAVEPMEGEDVNVEVGGKYTLESFTNALRGSKPGQELKFEVSYPADFSDNRLAGKTVAYDIQVKAIKKRILPELNDEFVKELGEYESVSDFEQKIREIWANDKRRRVESETKNRQIEALVNQFQFPVPESLVQQQIDARLDRGLRALAAQGMRAEDMRKLDFERLRSAQHDSALNEVKGSILLDKIADAEHIEVSDEEVEQELQLIALQTREPVEQLRNRLTQDGSLARIREQLRREKTGTLLYERA
jgi:trigger factor